MAEDKKKYENLDEANKGYNELYGMRQKEKEESKLNKQELDTLRTENATLKGAGQERTRRETELRNRLRSPGLTSEQRQNINTQFVEQLKTDPQGAVDRRVLQIIQGQGLVKKSEIDKQNDVNSEEEQAYNDFTNSHKDFETVRPAFLKRWNKLPAEDRVTKNLELAFAAARGDMTLANPVDLKKEKDKMREELKKEMRDKAALAGGKKIRTQKEIDEDEKQVNDIKKAHKETKASIY